MLQRLCALRFLVGLVQWDLGTPVGELDHPRSRRNICIVYLQCLLARRKELSVDVSKRLLAAGGHGWSRAMGVWGGDNG